MRFVFNEFALDCEQRVLWMEGNIVPLSPKAFDTLRLLVENEGRIVTKQEFMAKLWPDSFVEESNLTQNIFVLRKVLGTSADGRPLIETIPKRGYRFAGVVHREETAATVSRSHASAGPVPPAIPEAVATPSPVTPSRASHWRLMVVAASIAVLLSAYFALGREPGVRIGGYQRLTNDGRQKDLRTTVPALVTDTKEVYFTELKGNRSFLAQVPVNGGEISYDDLPIENAHVVGWAPGERALLFATNWHAGTPQPLLGRDLATGAFTPFLNIHAQDASWSTDGKNLAYTQAGKLFVRTADGSTMLVASVRGLVYWPRWSPDGSILRFSQNYDGFHDRLWEVDSSGKNLHEPFVNGSDRDHICCGSWTASGHGFVYLSTASNNNSIHVRPEREGFWNRWREQSFDIPAAPLDKWITPVPGPDGKHVFAIGEQLHGQLVRIDPVTRRPEPFAGGISAEGVNFSPDQKNIVWTAYPEGTLWTSRADGSGRVQLTQLPLVARFPRWSPDGTTVVFTAARPGSDWQLYTVPAHGGEVTPLLHETAGQGVATWSPDGKALVFGHLLNSAREQGDPFNIELLRLADRHAIPIPGSAGLWTARWSPDGRFISAVTLDNQTLRLYDMQTRTWSDLAHGNINDVVWSPDSHSLFFDTDIGADAILYRVLLSQRKTEPWADLRELHRAGFFGPWLGMAPDGSPLLLEDASIEELYSVAVTLP